MFLGIKTKTAIRFRLFSTWLLFLIATSFTSTRASMDFQAMMKAERARVKAQMMKEQERKPVQPDSSAPHKMSCLLDLGHGVSYCDSFLTSEEAAEVVKSIELMPQGDWATLTKRRLLNLGGVPHPSGSWSEDLPDFLTTLVISRLLQMGVFSVEHPPNQVLLNEYRDGAGIDPHNDGPLFEPIACIVSLESDAMIHFFEEEQTTRATFTQSSEAASEDCEVSSPTRDRGSQDAMHRTPIFSVLLRQNSCLVFSGESYQRWTHSVPDCMVDIIDPATVANLAHAERKNPNAQRIEIKRSPRRLSLTLRRLHKVDRHCGEFDVLPPEVEAERARRRRWWLSSISE